jgi:hypothetical protein
MKHKIYTVRLSVIIFLVLSYFLCGGSSVVIAQQTEAPRVSRAATIAVMEIDGTAQILSRADVGRQVEILGDLWKPALPRTMLNSGDQLRTGVDSSMKLQLNDGTIVAMSSDSLLVVEELKSARGQTPQTTQLKLEKGKISTQQMTKILGQTNQIIRTDNGSVNTRLGEVEVWKPEQEPRNYVLLAALSSQIPQVAQGSTRGDNTFVTLNRGTTVIESSGKGRMITNSLLLPETCSGQDGIKLVQEKPKFQVTVSKLEDQNGYLVVSNDPNEDFHLLVGTEGDANKIYVATQKSDAEIDFDGVSMAIQDIESYSMYILHPLLTVGVRSSDVKVNLVCDATESRGINDFSILGISGNVTDFGASFGGRGTGRPNPSRGRTGVPPTPRTPTPTPTPEEGEFPTPTPTPTPTPKRTPTWPGGGPTSVPLTYVFSPIPVIYLTAGDGVTVSGLGAGPCALNQNLITISFGYNDQSMGIYDRGDLIYRWIVFDTPLSPPWGDTWTGSWTGGAEAAVQQPEFTLLPPPPNPNPTYTFPAGESGHLEFSFCVDSLSLDSIGVRIWLRNQGGYTSDPFTYPEATFP